MRIYCLKTCDTCKKAISALRAAGHDPELTDVRADGLSEAQLRKFMGVFGEALVNRSSATWRGLSEAERGRDPVALLADHPTLMKRPVIEADGRFYLGWKADVQAALLG
jgi:arsenate reductase-like glutaredoxin family protein